MYALCLPKKNIVTQHQHVCLCSKYMPDAHGGQKLFNSPGTGISDVVGAGDQMGVL